MSLIKLACSVLRVSAQDMEGQASNAGSDICLQAARLGCSSLLIASIATSWYTAYEACSRNVVGCMEACMH
jgi:hypothetical protein